MELCVDDQSILARYSRLIDKAKQRNDGCPGVTNGNGALDLIFCNTKIDQVLDEVMPDEQPLSDDLAQMTVDSCMAYFKSVSVATSTELTLVVTHIFAQKFIQMCTSAEAMSNTSPALLNKDLKVKVLSLITVLKKIVAQGSFDKVLFTKRFFPMDVPLELIWLLHAKCLVTLYHFVLNLYDNTSSIDQFCHSIRRLCYDATGSTLENRLEIVQAFMDCLLEMYHGGNEETEPIVKKAKKIIFQITKHVFKESNSSSAKNKKCICLYQVIRLSATVPFNAIQTLFHEIFNSLLQQPCHKTDVQAFSCQEKWSYEFLLEAKITAYQQFFLVFRTEDILQIFERAMDTVKSETINIQVLANFLTIFLIYSEDSFKLLEDFFVRRTSEAFETCNFPQLRLLFLLRRQAALEGNHVSPSYSSWFEKTFVVNAVALGLHTKRAVQFFCKFLGDIVPFESPVYLKVHIFKLQVPNKFKHLIDDYVSLAKTRLADLNENLEDNTGIFQNNGKDDEQTKVAEQADHDVKKVLKLYEDSGRVPSTIMEASIFRKPYFIGRFLPALLVPRKPPTEPDLRARFIEDLNRARKIPPAMLHSYQKKCDTFEECLPDSRTSSNVQVLLGTLKKLPRITLDAFKPDDTKGLAPWLSSVSRKLKPIFTQNENLPDMINLDFASKRLTNDQIQTSYAFVNTFCQTCLAVENSRNSKSHLESQLDNRKIDMRWYSKIIAMLFGFPTLIEVLYVRLWGTVCLQNAQLSQDHCYGLAALACQLSSTKLGQSSSIIVGSPENPGHYQSIADVLVSQMPVSSKDNAQFFTRWCSSFIQHALAIGTLTTNNNQFQSNLKAGVAYVPEIMITKLQYLLGKLKFRTSGTKDTAVLDEETCNLLKDAVPRLHAMTKSSESREAELKRWLNWELCNKEDILLEHERQSYYSWAVYDHFMSADNNEVDNTLQYRGIASVLLTAIMDHYVRSYEDGVSSLSYPAERNLLTVLQEMVHLIDTPAHDESMNTCHELSEDIWLLQCFPVQHIQNNVSGDLHKRCQVLAFLRLVKALPPWLLYGNSEVNDPSVHNTRELFFFFNNHMKPRLFSETFVIPFDLTVHLFKVFFPPTQRIDVKRIRLRSDTFQHFVQETPFFFGSLLYHWSQLKPLCCQYAFHSDILTKVNSYSLWLSSAVEETSQHSHTPLPQHVGDEPALAHALFLHLGKTQPKLIPHLLDCIQETNSKKMALYLVDNVVLFMVDHISYNCQIKDSEEYWFAILKAVILRFPETMRIFTLEFQDRKDLLSDRLFLGADDSSKFIPVIFFRMLLHISHESLSEVMIDRDFTQALLIMYVKYTQLYKECSQSAYEQVQRSFEPLQLKFFVQVRDMVKQCLMAASSDVLQSMPTDLISRTSDDIKYFLQDSTGFVK